MRMPYLDVLTHLHYANGILIFGSTEAHYSPSKLYQALLSGRPIFAVLHAQSTAVPAFEQAGGKYLAKLLDGQLPTAAELASSLNSFIDNAPTTENYNEAALSAFSARESTRILAGALDEAVSNGTEVTTPGERLL